VAALRGRGAGGVNAKKTRNAGTVAFCGSILGGGWGWQSGIFSDTFAVQK